MPYVDLFFDEYKPDLNGAPDGTAYLVDSDGLRPTPQGWKPIPTAATHASVTIGAAATMVAYNAHVTRRQSNFRVFTSNTYQIFRSSNLASGAVSAWSNVSRTTGYSTSGGFAFAEFGDYVFALDSSNPLQFATTGGTFADAATILPGVDVARVNDFLVVATQQGVRWSAISDPTNFPTPGSATAIATQSGAQTLLTERGKVVAVRGNDKFGLVWQDHSVTRMTYKGTIGSVFDFDYYEQTDGVGGFGGQCVVKAGKLFYWVSPSGVFVTDGYTVRRISDAKVTEKWFRADLTTGDNSDDDALPVSQSVTPIRGAFNDRLGLVAWTRSDTSLLYSLAHDQFSVVSSGRVLFDGPHGTSSRVDTVFYSLGSDNLLYRHSTLTAIPYDIQTGFIEPAPGYRVQLEGVHPIGAGFSDPTFVGYKAADDYENISVVQESFTTMTSPARDIKFTARDTARFFQFRISGTATTTALFRGLRLYYKISQSQ